MDHCPSGDGVKWTHFPSGDGVKWTIFPSGDGRKVDHFPSGGGSQVECMSEERDPRGSGKQTKDTRNQKGGECQTDTQTNKRTHSRGRQTE